MKSDGLRRLGVWAAIAIAISATAAPARAQDATDPRTDAKVHTGPIYLTPSVSLKDVGIDTNVFNNSDEKRDVTATLAPRVNIWLPIARRALITTTGTSDVVYYQTYASERSIDPGVKVRGEVFLNRLTVYVQPSYLRTRQRMNFELDARAQREERSTEVGVSAHVVHKLSVELAARASGLDFNADATFDGTRLRQTLNRSSRTESLAVREELTPLTSIVLRTESESNRFPLSPDRDADSIAVTPGVEFKPRALISGTAYVGFRRFTPRNAVLPAFRGAVANVSLAYTLADTTRLEFGAQRDLTYSYEVLHPYFLSEGYTVTAARRLVGQTDIRLSLLRYRDVYRDLLTAGVPPPAAGRIDVMRTVSATLGYRVARNTRTGIGLSYRSRRSNGAGQASYAGLQIMAIADYGF